MNKTTSRLIFVAASVLLASCFAPRAFAQNTAVIQFENISPNDGVYDGAYAGIYTGTVNGQAANFICDDFINEITYGQTWDANVNSSQGVTQNGDDNVRYAPTGQGEYDITNPQLVPGSGQTLSGVGAGLTQQQEYNMISWLVQQMFNDPNNNDRNWASLAGAIWSIADDGWNNGSGGFNSSYLSTNGGTETAQYFLEQALNNRNDTNLPDYIVYTPNGQSCDSCNATNGQEFFSEVVSAPESSQAGIMGADLLLFAAAVLVLRRRGLLVTRR